MQRIFSSPSTIVANQVKNLLDQEGIDCEVRGEGLTGMAGGIPSTNVWAEVWVIDDAQLPKAQQILEGVQAQQQATAAETWECPHCGEVSGGQFTACWNCAAERE